MNTRPNTSAAAAEKIDAVEVQERLDWPSATPGYCDTWLMVNAGDLTFKASEQYPVSTMANIGHQLLQEIAAYRPGFEWKANPAEIVGAMIEEIHARSNAPAAQGNSIDAACRALEGYADSYDQMARINIGGKVDCRSAAYDIRGNMINAVRTAARAVAPAVQSDVKAERDVIAERRRQLVKEGFDLRRDDRYEGNQIIYAAACYMMHGPAPEKLRPNMKPPFMWPWNEMWWKPTTWRQNYVKAAALLIAEIERIDRAAITGSGEVKP